MEPPSFPTDPQATIPANSNSSEVTMTENEGHSAYSYSGAMQHNENGYAEADMLDADEQYGSDDQIQQAPYYSNRNRSLTLDPRLATLYDDGMFNTDFQNVSEDPSAGQDYAGDVSSEDRTPSKPKAKRTKNGKKKQAAQDEEPEPIVSSEADDPANEDDDPDDEFLPEPVTPKKTKRKTATPKKTPKGKGKTPVKSGKSASNVREALPFHRQRRAAKNGISEARPIPHSYEECDEADKALLDMRDKENKTWKDIRVVWEEMTGQKTGFSTLPNRYERLKDNFSVIKEEHRTLLLAAKTEVEKEMADKKWILIADKVKQSGGDSYTADNLQRQYKKMMLKEGFAPPPGIVDPDYDIYVSEDNEDGDENEDEDDE